MISPLRGQLTESLAQPPPAATHTTLRAVVGRRRHQHVVAVGDDDRVGVTGQPGAQRALDVVDLADPVELVAGQIQQHDHRRVDRVGDVRHVHLVDLERGQRRVAGAGQRGHQTRRPCWRPRRWWRPARRVASAAAVIRVVVDLPLVPVTTTVRRPAPSWPQDRLVQRHRDQAADHRARAAAGHPRRPARGGPGGQRGTSPDRHRRPGHRRQFMRTGQRGPTRIRCYRALSGARAILTL